jgi:5-methylcytosine-specific restriction enzyme subunit McrC
MRIHKSNYTVFEHEILRFEKNDPVLESLQRFHDAPNAAQVSGTFPYYSLIHNGVRFCEYVGVLKVGKTTIEVLPKADKSYNKEDKEKIELKWSKMLIDMLRAVGIFNIHAPSVADLTLKPNSILDLYFELFLKETESLLHKGLIKRYRKTEGNTTALKGNLLFAKHIQQNIVHQERFYVKHSVYDQEHPLNCVLYKTLKLLHRINTNAALSSRIGALLLNFPELPDIKTDAAFFEKIHYTRKTEPYENAIKIARLILLNYHPDLSTGRNDVLALMFDMNLLWEQFVYKSLRKHLKDYTVRAQASKPFWGSVNMKPDILIEKSNGEKIVLDTKWKNIGDKNPSPEDLRQMYAYSKFHCNAVTALVYPSDEKNDYKPQNFREENGKECGVMKLKVETKVRQWQEEIACFIRQAINPQNKFQQTP